MSQKKETKADESQIIAFAQQSLTNQQFSNKNINLFYFTGRNFSDRQVLITSSGVNCGCTKISTSPIMPNDIFTVTIAIDKTNITGYVSQSAWLVFDNGKKFEFNVSGKIV